MPPESMVAESARAIKEIEAHMREDPHFAEAVRWFGAFFRKWFATAGYKCICQFLKTQ